MLNSSVLRWSLNEVSDGTAISEDERLERIPDTCSSHRKRSVAEPVACSEGRLHGAPAIVVIWFVAGIT